MKLMNLLKKRRNYIEKASLADGASGVMMAAAELIIAIKHTFYHHTYR